jgi:hypothetical protein
MAAGLGFKTFTTGEVLTAGDVNGYLMQGINVFATTTARDAAITAPAEGQFAFTKDTNGLWYYDGAAWVASGATGDIEGVTAGVGISGGGTSGTVTITNSMATAITTNGDLIYGTGSGTFTRRGIGSTGQVLTVVGGLPDWATISANPTVNNNTIADSETTTSTTYTNLSTVGPTVTMTTGTKALVIITSSKMGNNSGTREAYMSFAVSGASSVSASDARRIAIGGGTDLQSGQSGVFFLSGLTAGSNTFEAKYRVYGGTCTWADRSITVMDLGS